MKHEAAGPQGSSILTSVILSYLLQHGGEVAHASKVCFLGWMGPDQAFVAQPVTTRWGRRVAVYLKRKSIALALLVHLGTTPGHFPLSSGHLPAPA